MSIASDIYIDPSEQPPISTNPFAAPKMPYDVLQYVLNEFLTPADRFNFNRVLEPQERVYKRFPKDYSIRHQLIVSKSLWNSIANRVNTNTDNVFDSIGDSDLKDNMYKATHSLITLLHFFKEPSNQLTIRFIEGRKRSFLNNIDMYAEQHSDIPGMNINVLEHIIKQTRETCASIVSIPFERDVPTRRF